MLEKGPESAMLRYTLGAVCFKEKRYRQALDHLRRALAMNPDHSASWKIYGRALTAVDRNDEAKAAFEKGISVAEERGDIQAAKEMKVFLRRLD